MNIAEIKANLDRRRPVELARDYGALLLDRPEFKDCKFTFTGQKCTIEAPAQQGDDHPLRSQ